MVGIARIMRYARYIFALLFVLCYRGLSAQEFDLYDFRYYKRFESAEELLAPEVDSTEVVKFALDRNFSTRALDYNLSMVRSTRRGIARYRRVTTLNGAEIPFVGSASVRGLQLSANQAIEQTAIHIDTLREARTSAGFSFSSRNTPYSLSFATSQPLNNGWSLASNIRVATGRDLHIEGIFGNSSEVNAVASKLFDNKSQLSMALFIKPSMRSTRLASTKEAFRLTGNNLYNPAWGYQNGKVRNSRIRREFLPTAFIGYESNPSKRTKFNLSATATVGIERYSSLDWFDAQTPSPDNYRYMPSYFDDEDDIFLAVEGAWLANNPKYTQIDFDRLIATNRLNEGEAVYAISDRVRRTIRTAIRGEATTSLEIGRISYGFEATTANFRNYKQMRDLLEADHIVDLDYFLLDDDTYGNSLQNDTNNPNRHIKEGDRYGYDYAIRENKISVFGTYHYSTERFDLDIVAKVGYADISRRGFYRKELFAENSFGVSRHLKFSPYALRASAEYLIADNHFIRAIVATEATPCESEDLFLQSQYNNRTIDSPEMRSGYNAEVQYMFQRPNFKLSATLFVGGEMNDTRVRHLYDYLSGEYADIVTSNINYLRYGAEVEAEYRFADHFRATVATTIGRYAYATNSAITIYTDASNILLADHIESHTKGLSIGNAPQIVATAGLSYFNKGWGAILNANYAGLRYIEPSAVMRTERVLAMAVSPEQREALMEQERLGDAFTIDLSLSKSIYLEKLSRRVYSTTVAPRFTDKHPRSRILFRIGVRNLLGSTNIVYNGYESSRLQRHKVADGYIYNRQASRYTYAYPRTFYGSINFLF